MTCAQSDQDLLLLAHDALSFGERLRTLWHVRSCARCRVRLAEFEAVSRALSATINERPVHGPFARIPIVHGPRPGLPVALILIAALTLVILAGVTAAVVRRVTPHSVQATLPYRPTHCKHVPPSSPGGCAPNLPNDRCR